MPSVHLQLTQPQADFLDSTATYCGYVGGRGAGKSWIGAYKLIKRAKPGRTYMVIAPTYPMLRDATLRTLKQQLRLLHRPFTESKGDGVITLSNGANFLLRTANEPDRLRGPNLSGVWGDEASLFDEEVFEIAIPSLREAGEQGRLDLTFTPKGKSHWTYKRLKGEQSNASCELIHSHTRDNPFLPPNFVETIERQYGAGLLAKQELGGEFLDIGNTEWPATYFERPDFFYVNEPLPSARRCRVLFYDGAGNPKARVGDWHAAAILTITTNGHLYFDNRLWRCSQEQAAAILADIICTDHIDMAGVESNFGGEVMIPLIGFMLRDRGRPDLLGKWCGVNNTLDKDSRIRRLGTYLMQGLLHVKDGPNGRETLRQAEQFPVCDHDDALDAMDGAIQLAGHLMGVG